MTEPLSKTRFARRPHKRFVEKLDDGRQVIIRAYADDRSIQFEVQAQEGKKESYVLTRCYLERGDTANIAVRPDR